MNFTDAGGFKKCFWVLVMTGLAAALMYNAVQLTRNLDYSVSDHQQQLTLPSVTVGSLNPVKSSEWPAVQNEAVNHRIKREIGRTTTELYLVLNSHVATLHIMLEAYS